MNKALMAANMLRHAILYGDFSGKPALPGTRKLCIQLGVSRSTLSNALAMLVEEGLIVNRPRSGMFITGKGAPAAGKGLEKIDEPKRKCVIVAEEIANMISTGVYKVGEYLPFQKSLRSFFRVSRRTLNEAMEILRRKGLVRLRANDWIVGGGQPRRSATPKTVVIHQALVSSALDLVTFVGGLERELLTCGITISTPGSFGGFDSLAEILDTHRESLFGYVIPNTAAWLRKDFVGKCGRFMSEMRHLNHLGFPVVLNGAQAILQDFPQLDLRPFRNVYAIDPDREDDAFQVAAYLMSMGHNDVAFLNYLNHSWCLERYAHFRSGLKRVMGEGGAVTLHSANADPESIVTPIRKPSNDMLPEMNNALEMLLKGYQFTRLIPVADITRSLVSSIYLEHHLTGMISQFEKALAREQTTVWVCADPTVAFAAHDFLKNRGIAVPEELSLICFGDSAITAQFRVTVWDTELQRLSYLAAHCLLEDIPVKRTSSGLVSCPGRIIDRGSVGRPRM